MLANLKMPAELQDRYGYPEITDEVRKKIFGESFANMVGVDIHERARKLKLVA